MSVADEWFIKAREVYEGEDSNALLDRIFRAKGEADQAIFSFLLLREFRQWRETTEAKDKKAAK